MTPLAWVATAVGFAALVGVWALPFLTAASVWTGVGWCVCVLVLAVAVAVVVDEAG